MSNIEALADLVAQFERLVPAAKALAFGGPDQDVVYEGEAVPTIRKSFQLLLSENAVALAACQAVLSQTQAARDAALLSQGVFESTDAGLAATQPGGYFSVPSSDDAEYVVLYRNAGGVAVVEKRYPSAQIYELLTGTAGGLMVGLDTPDGPASLQEYLDEQLPLGRTKTQKYEVYSPTITRGSIVAAASSEWKYNHSASIRNFQGKWFALWNANMYGVEGQKPQFILQSTSADFATWSPPVKAFSEAAHAENPVGIDVFGAQWQPGCGVIGDELWAVWYQEGTNANTYFSRLTDADGLWHNTPLNLVPYTRSGVTYTSVFTTGDLVQLSSGRVLCPVVLQSAATGVLPPGMTNNGFFEVLKLAGVLYTDDGGASWQVGGMVTQTAAPWSVWEPFVAVQPDGSLRLYVRNLDTTVAASLQMLTAISIDEGDSWSALLPANVDVVSTRGTIENQPQASRPCVMIMNDNAKLASIISRADRRNLAVWTGLGRNDFTPGIGISDDALDNGPCYPTASIHDGKLYVAYSCYEGVGGYTTDIKTVVVDPAPPYGALMPRLNAGALISPTLETAPWRRFAYRNGMRMNTVANLSDMPSISASVMSVGAILRNNSGQPAVLDTRPLSNDGGVLVKLMPNVVVGITNGATYSERDTGLVAPPGQDVYVGISINGPAGTVDAWVVRADGTATSATLTLGHTVANLKPPSPAYLGSARVGSAVPAVNGYVRMVRIYGAVLSANQHRHIQQAEAATVGMSPWVGTLAAPPAAAIDLDAASSNAGTNNEAWTAVFAKTAVKPGSTTTVTEAGRQQLKIIGAASVGVPRPFCAGRDVSYAFAYKSPAGRAHELVLCTLGTADKRILIVKNAAGQIIARWFNPAQAADVVMGTAADEQRSCVSVLIQQGLVTLIHEGCKPVTLQFQGRPLFFLGAAWGISSVNPDVYFHVDVGSVRAKDVVAAEPSWAPQVRSYPVGGPNDVAETIQLPGEAWPRLVRFGSGKQMHGDGTYDPTLGASPASIDLRAGVLGTPSTSSFNIGNGAWNGGHLLMGSHHYWQSGAGLLRKKAGVPTSDTDGQPVQHKKLTGVTHATPGTSVNIEHGLGYTPTHAFPFSRGAGTVYATAVNETHVTVLGTAASLNFDLLVG